MEFIIATGLSGVGKSRAVNVLEDIGFYYADNTPPKLIPTFYDLCSQAKGGFQRVAAVTDIRGGTLFDSLSETLALMRKEGKKYETLFLDAGDSVLINRFKETRRKHPLAEEYLGSLEQTAQMERQTLKTVRECSDYIIDMSLLSPAQLKERISSLFLGDASAALMIHCVSFGFKHDLPPEADLVFDARCLPNPFYVEELRCQTGLDEPVCEHIMKWDQTKGFVTRPLDVIDYVLPPYYDEGKSQLVITIGCTSGRRRPVVLAQLLYNYLPGNGKRVSVNHRGIHKQEKHHVIFV